MAGTTYLEDRWVFRLGGLAAVAGALLGVVGNLIHPVTPIDDPEGVARVIAQSGSWVPIHLAIVFGIVLMLCGLVAIGRSIHEGLAGALSQLGMVAAVAGATIGLVHANETINFALVSAFNLVFGATTFILFGLAVALGDVYPRALGWVAVAAGVLSVAAGLIQAAVGEPTEASRLLTIIGPTLITLWLLIMGVLLLRQGRQASTRMVPAATPGASSG